MERIPDDELIGAYLDDELSSEERARAERLLVERADLRRLLEELRTLREGLRSLPAYHLGDDFGAAVLRRAEKEMLRENPSAAGESPAAAGESPSAAGEKPAAAGASPALDGSPAAAHPAPSASPRPASPRPVAPVMPASLDASGADLQTAPPASASSASTPSDPFARLRRPAVWSILAVAAALLLMFVVPRADDRHDALVTKLSPGEGAPERPSDRTARKSNADFDQAPAGARPEAASAPAAEHGTSRTSGLKSDGVKADDAKSTDAKSTDARSAEAKSAEAKSAEAKSAEAKSAEAKTYDLKSSDAVAGTDAAKSKDGRSVMDTQSGGFAVDFENRQPRQTMQQAALQQQAMLDRVRGVELVDKFQLLDQSPAERERLAESLQSRLAAEVSPDRPSDVLIVEVYARPGAIEGAFVPSLSRNRVANVDVEQLARSDYRNDGSPPVGSFGAMVPSQNLPSQVAVTVPPPAGPPSTNITPAGASPPPAAAPAQPVPAARPLAVEPPSTVAASSPMGGGGASPPAVTKPIAAKSAGNVPSPSATASNFGRGTPAPPPAGYAAKGPSAVGASSVDEKPGDKKTRDDSPSGAPASGAPASGAPASGAPAIGALAIGELKRQAAGEAGAAPQLKQLADGDEFYYVVADGPQLEALLNEISADNRNFVSVRVERRSARQSAPAPLSYAAAAPGPATTAAAAAANLANSAPENAGASALPAAAPQMKIGSTPLGDVAGRAPAPAETASRSGLPDRRPPASGVAAPGRGEPPVQRESPAPGEAPLAKSSAGQSPATPSPATPSPAAQSPATQPSATQPSATQSAVAGKEIAETETALRAMPAPGLASQSQPAAAPTATNGAAPAAGPLPPLLTTPDAYQSSDVEVPRSRAQRISRFDVSASLPLENGLTIQRGLAADATSANRPLDPSAERRMNESVPLDDNRDQAARRGAVAGAAAGQPIAAEQGASRPGSVEGQVRGGTAPAATAPETSPAGPSVAVKASAPSAPATPAAPFAAPALPSTAPRSKSAPSTTPSMPAATPAPPGAPPAAAVATPAAPGTRPSPAPTSSVPSVEGAAGGAQAPYGASGSARADDYARRREVFDALTRSGGRQEALFIFRVAPDVPGGSAIGDRSDGVNERPTEQSPASNPAGLPPASSQPTPPTQKAD